MTARILSLPERLHDVDPPAAQILGPDVTGEIVYQFEHDWWDVRTVDGVVAVKRMAAGIYIAIEHQSAAMTALAAQASGDRTLFEWLDDAGRRAVWNGLNADENTPAGTFAPGRLGLESERVKPTAILDSMDRLVTTSTGDPLETT